MPRFGRLSLFGLAVLTMSACAWALAARMESREGKPLAHMVFFTLKDRAPEAREAFAASCHKYLSGHEGTLSFSVGIIAEDVVEPGVSVRDFDVALHLVFANKEAEANYLKADRHTEFVNLIRDQLAQVRVFDSYLTEAK